jgi:hypothetical protein
VKKESSFLFKIVFVTFIILLVFHIALLCYENITTTSLHLGTVSGEFIHLILWSIVALLLLILIFWIPVKFCKKLLCAILICVALPVLNFEYFLGVTVADYYTFNNPKGDQYIVVRETTAEPGPGCVLYRSINPFFIQQTNDGSVYFGDIRPFRDKMYSIEWQENSVMLIYPVSGYDPDKTKMAWVKW